MQNLQNSMHADFHFVEKRSSCGMNEIKNALLGIQKNMTLRKIRGTIVHQKIDAFSLFTLKF